VSAEFGVAANGESAVLQTEWEVEAPFPIRRWFGWSLTLPLRYGGALDHDDLVFVPRCVRPALATEEHLSNSGVLATFHFHQSSQGTSG